MNDHIKPITIDQLQVGMFITDESNGWVPEGNRAKKGLINQPEVIEQIRRLGIHELHIDVSRGIDIQPVKKRASTKKFKHLPTPSVPLAKELENAKDIQSDAINLIEQCLDDVKMGRSVDAAPIGDITGGMIESLNNNHNALICLTQLREKDRYLMEHSFNVSVLMGVLASATGYEGDVLHQLVTGALLHDIGKIKVDDSILHKPGKLTPEEWQEMQNHVIYGEEILKASAGVTPIILDLCAQHHEKLDGTGYPRGLKGDEIPEHSRMLSVADVYDAITAERVYHKGMAPTLALKKLIEWSADDSQLDKKLVFNFVKSMGLYPAGSVVELDNQKLAVVIEANDKDQKKPVIKQIFDLKTRRYDNKFVIDLAEDRSGRHIIKPVYAESFGIKVGDFLN